MAKITLTLNFSYPINVSLQPKPTNVTSDSAHVDAVLGILYTLKIHLVLL